MYIVMYVCLINIKLCWWEEAVVLACNLYKITELRKRKLQVEILHDLKEF